MSEPLTSTESDRIEANEPNIRDSSEEVAPASLAGRQTPSASGYEITNGEPYQFTVKDGGLLIEVGHIRSLGADCSSSHVRSPQLMQMVLGQYIIKSKQFSHVTNQRIIDAWANHPDNFFPGPIEGPDEEVVLLAFRKNQYWLLGLPTNLDYVWDFGADENYLILSSDLLAEHGIETFEIMTDAARENFAQAVLASLEEETGLLASPEALALLTNVRSSGLKTGGERWMLRLNQNDLRQLFDDGVWDAWRAENLGEGGDSTEGTTAANTDGLSGSQLDSSCQADTSATPSSAPPCGLPMGSGRSRIETCSRPVCASVKSWGYWYPIARRHVSSLASSLLGAE